ncbi:MAG: MATE family efflux transporter [Clostridia bacterium]|nr:MATE family efflux transporter [Clostridia bacterium]
MRRYGNVSTEEMTNGPLFGKIVRYTIPVILTGVLQLLFNAADLVVVGQFCGQTSVAAVGATGALINLIVNLFIGLSVGAGVTAARSLGAGREEETQEVVHTAIPTALIGGIILTAVGLIFSHFFLTLMGTPDDVIELSTLYMRIYFCGMLGSMVFNYGAAILRAAGNTEGPLAYLTLSGVVNVILNVIFVVLFQMDVAGVALATALTQTLSAVLVVRDLMKRTDALHLDLLKLRISRCTLVKMIKIGLPAGIQGSLFSISNVLIQSSVNSFGSVVMSGNSSAANLEGFIYVSMNAFHQTALNFTGQNCGAQKYDRVKKVATICILDVGIVGAAFGTLMYTLGPILLKLYLPTSPEALEIGLVRMSVICLTYFSCGMMDVMTGVLRGMGSSLMPMLISVLGVCGLRILWIETVFRLEEFHNLISLYLTYPMSWVLSFCCQLIAFLILFRKMKKMASQRQLSAEET